MGGSIPLIILLLVILQITDNLKKLLRIKTHTPRREAWAVNDLPSAGFVGGKINR